MPSKQGFALGSMPLTLFILTAAAILYLHLSGQSSGQVKRRYNFFTGEVGNATQREATGYEGDTYKGPVNVSPPAPAVPPPKFEMPQPHLVPIPGDPGIGGSLMN